MSMKRSNKRIKRVLKFSLIELLVVIAIIAILQQGAGSRACGGLPEPGEADRDRVFHVCQR